MNPNNPNFRTEDEWFELCGKLQQELGAAKAQIADYEAALEKYTEQETYGDLAVGSFIPISIAMHVLNKWRAK